MLNNLELEIVKSNINALDYEVKVVRLINAILEADRLLALKNQDQALNLKEAA